MRGSILYDPNEPVEEFTETIRCDDCGDDTRHEVQFWPVGGSTQECGTCRLVSDYQGERV